MPTFSALQPSFAAGELTPYLWGRPDLAKFKVGARTMQNFMVHPQGGASNRAGTMYVCTVDDSTKRHRLIPFQFRTLPAGQTYALIFGDLTMQVVMNNGTSIGPVLFASKAITGITQASNGSVTCTGHGFVNGSKVLLAGIVGMTQINGVLATVTVVNANTFTIGINTSGYGAYVSGGTAGGNAATFVSPYAYTDLPLLKFVQSADTLTFTHPSYAPTTLTRTSSTAWVFDAITFAPTTPAPTDLASGSGGSGGSTLVVTAIDATNGEESLASSPASSSSTTDSWTWNAVSNAALYNIYKQSGSIFGFIAQVAVNSFTEADAAPDTADQPSTGSVNPFPSTGNYPGATGYYMQRQWFGDTTNNPGGSWASQAGAFFNMNTSVPTQDSDAITRTLVSGEVDEIRHFFPVGTSMMILTSGAEWRCWPGPASLALTPGSCYTLPQSDHGSSHTPPFWSENTLVMFQEKGATLLALRYDAIQDIYTSQDMGVLASHLFSDVEGSFQIQERGWAATPFRICWCVRSDGVLLGFTYMREQDVYAWHRHITAGLFESVCTITEPDGYGGYEDAVYVIVNRTINGQTARYVERMVSRSWGASIANAWFVDCGLKYNGWNTNTGQTLIFNAAAYAPGSSGTLTASGFTPFSAGNVGQYYTLTGADGASVLLQITAYSSSSSVSAEVINNTAPASTQNIATSNWAAMITEITNATWLAGQMAAILGDGSVVPSGVVSPSGVIALNGPYAVVIAGLYTPAILETLNLEIQSQGGTAQGEMKKVAQMTIRLKDSVGPKVGIASTNLDGSDDYELVNIKQRLPSILMGTATQPMSADFFVELPTEWNTDGRLLIEQLNPLPVTVLDLIPKVDLGD